MRYLKLVNCPIKGLFPKKSDLSVDWGKCGMDIADVARFSKQGFDVDGDYVSIIPVKSEAKLVSSGIIAKTNGNLNDNDTAEIISDEDAQNIKQDLEGVRNA